MFPQNGLISAKLHSPIKIASTETFSSLPAAKRALPAAKLPVELQMGARPPGLVCAWGAGPGAPLRHGASRLTRGSRGWRQSHPRTAAPGSHTQIFLPTHLLHTHHICAPSHLPSLTPPISIPEQDRQPPRHFFPYQTHTRCPCRTPRRILSLPRTPCLTLRCLLLPPTQPERSLWIFPFRCSPHSPQHHPGPLTPVPGSGDAALRTSRGITPRQVLSAPLFISEYFCECGAQNRDSPDTR